MTRSLFLSASVPDPERNAKYHTTADIVAIRDAVRALVTIVLPKARLVWGGHPAITPLVRVIAKEIGITGADSVRLYQSNFFKGQMPKDNAIFELVKKIPAVKNDREASLLRMRKRMIGSEQFDGGIFIGGMEGVEEEHEMFRTMHPKAVAFPIASTGAAALLIYERERRQIPSDLRDDLLHDMAYPSLLRRLLKFLE
jgi:hypothetical protein